LQLKRKCILLALPVLFLGCQKSAPAPSVAKALKLIEEVGCDVAVLDVNLRDETAEAVARELRSRRTPFLFLSAVSRDHLPSGFNDEVLLPKPARPAVLVAALQNSISGLPHN